MTREQFGEIVATLCAALDRDMTDAQAAIWYELLQRLPAEAVRAAVVRYLAEVENPFLPTPATIIRLATESMHGVAESPESAYRRLCLLRISWGNATNIDGKLIVREHIDDRLWKAVESAGGWERFCGERSGSKESEFAQFRDAWNRQTEHERRALALPAAVLPKLQGPREVRS